MESSKIPSSIVIFGASAGAVKVLKILLGFGMDVEFLVDNDAAKWGKMILGKEVKPPRVLLEKPYSILVGSNFQTEIEEQLSQMGLIDRLIIKDQIIMEYMERHMSEFSYLQSIPIQKEKTHFFDLTEGLSEFSGIESWTFSVARELKKQGKKVEILFSEDENEEFPSDLQSSTWEESHDYDHYFEYINKLVIEIASHLPCVVFDNWQNHILIAVSIIKRFHPDKIKCVSVLHNDKKIIYRKTAFMYPYIDVIAGVSRDILKTLKNEYQLPDEKFCYKESSVVYEKEFEKEYSLDTKQPLRIGFAARIVKLQKRADLLIPLFEELEKRNINYRFEIAGNGDYLSKLDQWIKENKLERKITLYGFIERKKMPQFWKEVDVFVNVADYEGTCLSMLESMSYGAVPVLTGVSGVNDFIEQGVNGYIIPLGQVKEAAEAIEALYNHRELLVKMGNINRQIIQEKCSMSGYMEYIAQLAKI